MIHITYSNNPIIVVDGNELANRAYFGFSKDEDIKSPMTLGFLTMLNAVVHRIVWYAKVRNNELPLNIVLAFDGKNNVWNFSLYTTKDDVDILSIAKQAGGGGHARACGFQVSSEQVIIDKEKIIFIDKEKFKFE